MPMRFTVNFILVVVLFFALPITVFSKELRVGAYDYPPLVSRNANGTIVGIFPDILDDFARQYGFEVVYVFGTWDENLAWLNAGKIDLVIGMTQSRGQNGSFSLSREPVLFSWSQIYTKKGKKLTSLFDLQGKRVAALREDINIEPFKALTASFGIHVDLVEADSIEAAFRLLNKGDVMAVIAERITSQFYETTYRAESNPIVFSPQTLAFGTAKGKNQALLDALDRFIEEQKADPDSQYHKIIAAWKESAPTYELPEYVVWGLGGVMGLLLLSVGGNMLLKRQVRRKTVELSLQNEALQGEIAERRRTQNDLKQAKDVAEAANKAKDQFIAMLSHELRTPLTPILATVTALQGSRESFGLTRDEAEVIRRNAQLETRLIDDLLDLTRISNGKLELHLESVDAHECLNIALDICGKEAEAKHLQISCDLRADRHYLHGDPARLQQVFWNLLKNAVKFTPQDGKICIRSENDDGLIRLEIADSGVGIEPEVMNRLFKPFEQGEQTRSRRFGGLGLGLHIAKSIVDAHHGAITCTSAGTGQGSTFIVEFETIPNPAASTAPPVDAPPRGEQPSRILLVDDHLDTLRTLSRLLDKWHYSVQPAGSVREALGVAEGNSFDLLISDIGLPDGSGLEIMRQAKQLYGLRGIALSGYGTDDDIRLSHEAGFAEHLTKPIDFRDLRAAIQRILAEGPTENTPPC